MSKEKYYVISVKYSLRDGASIDVIYKFIDKRGQMKAQVGAEALAELTSKEQNCIVLVEHDGEIINGFDRGEQIEDD